MYPKTLVRLIYSYVPHLYFLLEVDKTHEIRRVDKLVDLGALLLQVMIVGQTKAFLERRQTTS